MHEELYTPDTTFGWVCSGLDVPGWKLFWESADVGPLAGSGEFDDLGACSTEFCELFCSQDRRDDDEAISVERVEVRWFRHC